MGGRAPRCLARARAVRHGPSLVVLGRRVRLGAGAAPVALRLKPNVVDSHLAEVLRLSVLLVGAGAHLAFDEQPLPFGQVGAQALCPLAPEGAV